MGVRVDGDSEKVKRSTKSRQKPPPFLGGRRSSDDADHFLLERKMDDIPFIDYRINESGRYVVSPAIPHSQHAIDGSTSISKVCESISSESKNPTPVPIPLPVTRRRPLSAGVAYIPRARIPNLATMLSGDAEPDDKDGLRREYQNDCDGDWASIPPLYPLSGQESHSNKPPILQRKISTPSVSDPVCKV